jgi:hypothetical protein
MFGRESHRLRVAVVPGSPVRFASWHPWNMRWLQRWGTPLGCWGSPFGTNGPFTSSLGIIIITMLGKCWKLYISIYITCNTSIKYAIIIDVVHVHNIIILIHIIYLHLKPPSSSWCISYIYMICLDLTLICHECHPIHLTTRRTAWSLVSWEVWKIWRLCCQ